MTEKTITDLAGNQIKAGDWVVYPRWGYGPTLAKVLKVHRSSLTMVAAHAPKTKRYRDKRTGKAIWPSENDYFHYEEKPRTVFLRGDKQISSDQFYRLPWSDRHRYTSKHIPGKLFSYVETYLGDPCSFVGYKPKCATKVTPTAAVLAAYATIAADGTAKP